MHIPKGTLFTNRYQANRMPFASKGLLYQQETSFKQAYFLEPIFFYDVRTKGNSGNHPIFISKEASMKWIKGFIGAALIVVAMGITGCYTVIMVPQTVESYDNGQWSQEESSADTTEVKQDNGQTVNNFYIYDDWPGHSYFDPFWDSPYHWRYSSWWGGAFYDPWYDPWPYYGYYGNYGWSPYNHYGYVDWYTPGYHDPYWVYMDGYHGRRDGSGQRGSFDRNESRHDRRSIGDPRFSAASAFGVSRVGKAGAPNTGGLSARDSRKPVNSSVSKAGSGAKSSIGSGKSSRGTFGGSDGRILSSPRGSSGSSSTRRSGSGSASKRSSTPSSPSVEKPSQPSSGHSGSSSPSSSSGRSGGHSFGGSSSSGSSSSGSHGSGSTPARGSGSSGSSSSRRR
jgi:hypothetical protein